MAGVDSWAGPFAYSGVCLAEDGPRLTQAKGGSGREWACTWAGVDGHARGVAAAVSDLVRSRAHLRDDLARARQRVSKMLLRYGRVYPKRVCWTKQHRLWLADQRWDHTASELAYLDYLAAVDGLVARREAIDERL